MPKPTPYEVLSSFSLRQHIRSAHRLGRHPHLTLVTDDPVMARDLYREHLAVNPTLYVLPDFHRVADVSPLVSLTEAAEERGCTPRTIRFWVADGLVSTHRLVSGPLRVDLAEVMAIELTQGRARS